MSCSIASTSFSLLSFFAALAFSLFSFIFSFFSSFSPFIFLVCILPTSWFGMCTVPSVLPKPVSGVGAWQPLKGAVRLDGAELAQWSAERLGAHIGYLPQDIELFEGSVAQNIARFDPEAKPEAIISAARQAGVHDNPLGQRLTALMISKGLADASVPMSLLADHPNVQFNYYRGGLGTCAVEMH